MARDESTTEATSRFACHDGVQQKGRSLVQLHRVATNHTVVAIAQYIEVLVRVPVCGYTGHVDNSTSISWKEKTEYHTHAACTKVALIACNY